MNLTANAGTEVRINGVPGAKQDITLSGDETPVEVQLIKGESTRVYNFVIYPRTDIKQHEHYQQSKCRHGEKVIYHGFRV